jgi:hypothetical protein
MSFDGIAIGIATSGRKVDIRWAMSLPGLGPPVGMSVAWMVRGNPDIERRNRLEKHADRAKNREIIAEKVVDIGAEYLFFLDDDTICPNFTLTHLHTEIEKDPSIMICGGIYCTKSDPPQPIVFKKLGGGPYYKWKVGDIFECAGLGTGAMLIKTEVFKHLSKPWFFEPRENPVDKIIDLGDGEPSVCAHEGGTDDLYFCDKVTKAGFKIMAHGGVLPVHLDQDGKMYTLPLDSYPCKGMGLKELYKPNPTIKSKSRRISGRK